MVLYHTTLGKEQLKKTKKQIKAQLWQRRFWGCQIMVRNKLGFIAVQCFTQIINTSSKYWICPILHESAYRSSMKTIHQSVRRSTCGASMEQILANSTWPESANMMWSLKVENHISHSKSAVSCRPASTTILEIWEHFCKQMMTNELHSFSYHFPPKVVPSWLHAGFESLSVCTG